MKKLIFCLIYIFIHFLIFAGGTDLKKYCNDFLIQVINGNYIEVENYLKNGTDPDMKDTLNNITAIIHSVEYNHEDIAILLYKYGANVNAENYRGETLLALACQSGFKNLINNIITSVDDVNHISNEGMTILEYLIPTGEMCWSYSDIEYENEIIDILKILIENKLDLNIIGSDNLSIIDKLAVQFSYIDNEYPPSNIVKFLLKNGAVIGNIRTSVVFNCRRDFENLLKKESDKDKLTDLLVFIFKNHHDSYFSKKIIEKGVNLNFKDKRGYNLLHFAARGTTDISVYEALIKRGIDINSKTNDGFTPLMLSCSFYIEGRSHPAEYFIKNGADVNQLNNNNDSAILIAVSTLNFNIIKLIMNAKPDINQVNNDGKNILIILAEHRFGDDKIADLLKNGGVTASNIHEAVILGDITAVEKYTKSKSELNKISKDFSNLTPIHLAAKYKRIDIMKYLLKRNVNTNSKDNQGNTPLLIASMNLYGSDEDIINRLDVVKLLLMNNADVNIKNESGNSSLHYAVNSNNFDAVALLIKSGADVNSVNNKGLTPFIINDRINYSIMEFIIKNGADVNYQQIKDKSPTALSNAVLSNDYKVVELLLQNGSDPDTLYYPLLHGPASTMLMLAANEKIFDLLLKYGADINKKNSSNQEYFSYVYSMQDKKRLEWFEKKGFYLTPNVKTLNVREDPDISSEIIDKVHLNEKLEYVKYTWGTEIDGINANWIKIITPKNKSGWCFGGYLIIKR